MTDKWVDVFDHAACKFIERTAHDNGWTYHPIDLQLWDGRLHTSVVPRIGDKVTLPAGVYKVIDLMWVPPSMGSIIWPYPSGLTKSDVSVDILVEASIGFYIDEVITDGGETAE